MPNRDAISDTVEFPINIKTEDLIEILMGAVEQGGTPLLGKMQEALDVVKSKYYAEWYIEKYL